MRKNKIDLTQSLATSISVVINQYPSKTCWIHVNQDDIYTPIENRIITKDMLKLMPDIIKNVGTYRNDVPVTSLKHTFDGNSVELTIDMDKKQGVPYLDEFAGCFIRMEETTHDWYQYLTEDFALHFHYLITDTPQKIWLEIKTDHTELAKKEITLNQTEGDVSLKLNELAVETHEWHKVKEICFVIRASDSPQQNKLKINSLELIRTYS